MKLIALTAALALGAGGGLFALLGDRLPRRAARIPARDPA